MAQYAGQSGSDTIIFVTFSEAAVLNAISINGTLQLTVSGRLISGQQFSGSDSVTLSH